MQKRREQYIISDEKELDKIAFPLLDGDVIFFRGDLGSGKSTFIRSLLRRHFDNPELIVRSPTYTYYQSYGDIHHFDLYRISDPGVWMSIGGDEIAKNPSSILLIEWPEILGEMLHPTKEIHIETLEDEKRKITITFS